MLLVCFGLAKCCSVIQWKMTRCRWGRCYLLRSSVFAAVVQNFTSSPEGFHLTDANPSVESCAWRNTVNVQPVFSLFLSLFHLLNCPMSRCHCSETFCQCWALLISSPCQETAVCCGLCNHIVWISYFTWTHLLSVRNCLWNNNHVLHVCSVCLQLTNPSDRESLSRNFTV